MYYSSAEELFKTEYGYFSPKNTAVRDFTFAVLNSLPDSFTKTERNGMENHAVKKARHAASIAASMLGGSHDADLFSEKERDMIISALLLCDGFLYDSDDGILYEHPLRMSFYIRNKYWEPYLPQNDRDMIAYAVEMHSDKCNRICGLSENDARIWTAMPWLVHEISAKSDEAFPELPFLEEEKDTVLQERSGFEEQLSKAKKFLKGMSWNGVTYVRNECTYLRDGRKEVRVPDNIRDAVQTIGQGRKKEKQEEVFSYDNFRKMYPEWNGIVYGEKDEFMIKPCCTEDDMIPISNRQAKMLGIAF